MMNEFEEWVRTHADNALTAMAIARSNASADDRNDDANYWQHEINALVDVIRKLPDVSA